jgi:hypothetical protein
MRGKMSAVAPRIRAILKILLPTIFPTEMSSLPVITAKRETTNSGALVPAETIVKPIKAFDIFALEAIATAPCTSQFPETISAVSDTIKIKKLIKTVVCRNYLFSCSVLWHGFAKL